MKTMADVLALPDDSRRLVKWSLSQGQVTVAEAAEFLGVEASIARRLLEELRNHGFMESTGDGLERSYRVRIAARRSPRMSDSLWKALGEPPQMG